MKVEARILLLLGVFFGVMCIVYWFWGHEIAGAIMMLGGTFLGFLPGSYYYYWSRRMAPRPEDRSDATLEDGAGVRLIRGVHGGRRWGGQPGDCPVTEDASDRLVRLPFYNVLDEASQVRVIEGVLAFKA